MFLGSSMYLIWKKWHMWQYHSSPLIICYLTYDILSSFLSIMQPYALFTYTSFRNMYPLSKIVPREPLAERADTCERTTAYWFSPQAVAINLNQMGTHNSFYRELGSDLRLMGSLNLNKFEPESSLISSLILIKFEGAEHFESWISLFWRSKT